MYQGYRLKIEGETIPNTIMAKGSYSISKEDRTAETWTDAFGKDHVRTYGKTKTTITFSLREHDSTEHGGIVAVFRNRHDVSVDYYDDDTDTYKNGMFRMTVGGYAHRDAHGEKVQYNTTPVTLEEY